MDWSSFIPTVVTVGSSLLNSVTQNAQIDKYLKAQSEENEKAYQRNVEMWKMQNEYNSPTAVVQRLKSAGLNPALAYGNISGGLSSGAPALSPTDYSSMLNKRSVSSAALAGIQQARLIESQIRNIDSQTEQNIANTEQTLTYNKYQDALLTGDIKFKNASIDLMGSESDLNDARSFESYRNCERIIANTNEIYARIQEIEASVRNLDADTAIKSIQREWLPKEKQAAISEMYASVRALGASADLTREQFEQLLAEKTYNLAIKKTQSSNMFLEGLNLSLMNDELGLQIDIDKIQKAMSEYDKSHQSGQRAIDNITRLVSSFTGAYRDVMFGAKYGRSTYSSSWNEVYDSNTGRYVPTGTVTRSTSRYGH